MFIKTYKHRVEIVKKLEKNDKDNLLKDEIKNGIEHNEIHLYQESSIQFFENVKEFDVNKSLEKIYNLEKVED